MVRPAPVVRSRRKSWLEAACSGAGNPHRLKVSEIWRSSCRRSVTTTMVGLPRRGSRRSLVASQSMVSDLPDPWVCQTTPPPLIGFATRQHSAHRRAHGPVLLVARQLLDQMAPAPARRLRSRARCPAGWLETAGRRLAGLGPLVRSRSGPVHLVFQVWKHRLPFKVGGLRRSLGGVDRPRAAVGDA